MRKESVREVGTLKYFRERIMRYNVHPEIKKDVEAFQDFFLSVGRAYIIVAFTEFFGMESLTGEPTRNIPLQNRSRVANKQHFKKTFDAFVDTYILQECDEEVPIELQDKVMNYGLCVIEFTVLLQQMIDTVHEGDGERLLVNMKYLLLMFKAKSNYSKYAIEGMRFITQVKCNLSQQLATRVTYGRFVNTARKKGRNLETDLAMEHTIKSTKNLINAMGANKTEASVQRATRAVSGVQQIVHSYDACSNVTPASTAHARKGADKDEQLMIADLMKL